MREQHVDQTILFIVIGVVLVWVIVVIVLSVRPDKVIEAAIYINFCIL